MRELVISPLVMDVLTTATPVLPKVAVLLLQETEDLPQEKAYLVLRIETLPLVKEVLLDGNVVFHSLLESLFNCVDVLGVFALAAGDLSI